MSRPAVEREHGDAEPREAPGRAKVSEGGGHVAVGKRLGQLGARPALAVVGQQAVEVHIIGGLEVVNVVFVHCHLIQPDLVGPGLVPLHPVIEVPEVVPGDVAMVGIRVRRRRQHHHGPLSGDVHVRQHLRDGGHVRARVRLRGGFLPSGRAR